LKRGWPAAHSVKGAQTSAVIFSLVESCKLNKINPRKYFKDLVERLHRKEISITPYEYSLLNVT
jgi:hypothetical protein